MCGRIYVIGRQTPKHRVNLLRRQLRAPSSHGVNTAMKARYDILDDKFAWDDVRGIFGDQCREFFAHQIGKYLANGTEGDRAAADRRDADGFSTLLV